MNHDTATQDQVERFYDAEAESYDASRYESLSGVRRDRFHKALLLQLLELPQRDGSESPSGHRILEIGCGTGRFLEVVGKVGFQVTGVDISAGMLERARGRLDRAGLNEIDLHQTAELSFPPKSFTAVYSIFVVNLIPDYQRWLRNVAAVLTPGGALVFNVPNLSSIYWPFGVMINRRQRTTTANAAGARYSHWFATREWRNALKEAGFEVEAVFGEPPWCGSLDRCKPIDGRSLTAMFCKSLFIKARLIAR
jgi:ubiquinone/menaquinone biosynthesis C-methylase UbiE